MLKSFCCMRLRTAGIVIGWLGIAGSTLSIILLCSVLGSTTHIGDQSSVIPDDNDNFYAEIQENSSSSTFVDSRSILLGVVILHLIASGMLLLGTLKNRHLMLLPWLINTSINIAFIFLYILGGFYAIIGTSADPRVFVALFSVSFSLTVTIYFFCAIYSLYKEIQRANDQTQLPLIQPQEVFVPHQTTTYPNYAKM